MRSVAERAGVSPQKFFRYEGTASSIVVAGLATVPLLFRAGLGWGEAVTAGAVAGAFVRGLCRHWLGWRPYLGMEPDSPEEEYPAIDAPARNFPLVTVPERVCVLLVPAGFAVTRLLSLDATAQAPS